MASNAGLEMGRGATREISLAQGARFRDVASLRPEGTREAAALPASAVPSGRMVVGRFASHFVAGKFPESLRD